MSQDPDIPHIDSPKSNNQDSDTIEEDKVRVLGFKEDWAMIPLSVFFLIGFIVSIIDFLYIQMRVFQLVCVIIGIPMLAFGSALRILPIMSLSKAGFESLLKIKFLQILARARDKGR